MANEYEAKGKSPRERFMASQGFGPETAYSFFIKDKDTVIFTYSPEDVADFKVPANGLDLAGMKAEDLPRKVGGIFKIYAENKPYEMASQKDFLHSLSKLYNLWKTGEILNDNIYSDAYCFLIDKYCLSKVKGLEKMLSENDAKADFAVEAKISRSDIFGKEVYDLSGYILYNIADSGEGQKKDIKAYEDVAYALAISQFDNFLFTDLEAQRENDEDFEVLLNEFKAKMGLI